MSKLDNKGVALIAAVATTVIFLALVATIAILSMTTYKRTVAQHDRAMALNLAEAGIHHTLFKMNYQYYGKNYRDDGSLCRYPSATGYCSFFTDAVVPDTDFWAPADFNVGSGNGYKVKFVKGTNPNEDKLVSTGRYNGKTRTVSIQIRGNNAAGYLNNSTNGIAEAFNKHAVYAGTVIYTAGNVTGNITSTTDLSIASIPGDNSRTRDSNITYAFFPAPDMTAFSPADPGAWTGCLKDADGGDVPGYQALLPGYSPLPSWVTTYSDVDVYVISNQGIPVENWLFTKANGDGISPDNQAGDVNLTGSTILPHGAFLESNGTVTVSTTGNVDGIIKADGDIIIDSVGRLGATGVPVTLSAGGSITIPAGISVTGNLTAGGAITLVGNTITGTVVAGTTLTLRKNSSTSTPCTISSPGSGGIAIVVYNSSGSANVNLQDNTTHSIAGLVYVGCNGGGSATANLTFESGNTSNITGTVVVKDQLNMGGASGSQIRWNSPNFKNSSLATCNVYDNFFGGRRVYLPVPGSWREE